MFSSKSADSLIWKHFDFRAEERQFDAPSTWV